MLRTRKGFTLVELLIVVAIIAVLSAVGLSLFTNAQRRTRDARRREDLKQIQGAFEKYYVDNPNIGYPDTVVIASGLFAGGIAPTDPRGAAVYVGWTDGALGTASYNVCADLELTAAGAVDTWTGAESNTCVTNLQ